MEAAISELQAQINALAGRIESLEDALNECTTKHHVEATGDWLTRKINYVKQQLQGRIESLEDDIRNAKNSGR